MPPEDELPFWQYVTRRSRRTIADGKAGIAHGVISEASQPGGSVSVAWSRGDRLVRFTELRARGLRCCPTPLSSRFGGGTLLSVAFDPCSWRATLVVVVCRVWAQEMLDILCSGLP